MKKTVFLSFFSFIVGIGLTWSIVVNPLDFHFVHLIQGKVGIAGEPAVHEGSSGQLWTCGMHPEVIQESPGICPICRMDLTPVKPSASTTTTASGERKIKHWQAPMDPTFISDQPGKSPMGMDLIPVYEDEAADPAPGTVQIDPVFVQNIGVQSVPVNRGDIPFTIRTVGNLTYNESQVSLITTKYKGWIEKVHVNYIGESITRGERLFEVYSPELVNSQEEYLSAISYAQKMEQSSYPKMVARASSLLESARRRLSYWDVTEDQIMELEETRKARRTLPIFSPVDGVVVEKMGQALEGMFVQPGMNLYKIVDLSTIWVEAEVLESQVGWLKEGGWAQIEMLSQPGRVYRGKIRYLHPSIDGKSRTLRASIELPNPGSKLRAEMYADVTFEIPSARGVLTVPEEAVIQSGTRNIVVLDLGNGTFQVREIELGLNGQGLWEIKSGLLEGELVVTSSQFLIDSESNLREAIQKMINSRKAPDENEQLQMPASTTRGNE